MLQSSDHVTLMSEADRLRPKSVATLLDQNSDRVSQLTFKGAGLTLDASKQLIDEQVLEALTTLAAGADLAGAYERLLTGAEVNITEERAALHTLLRGTAQDALPAMADEVNATLSRMRAATEAIHSGEHAGASGQRFTDVINIGIGGSDLGPRMVCRALDDASPKLKTTSYPTWTLTIWMW